MDRIKFYFHTVQGLNRVLSYIQTQPSPRGVLSFVSMWFPAGEPVAGPVDGYVGPAQELLVFPLQAPLLQDAVEGVLSSIEEPFIVDHEVPAGVDRITGVRYVGTGVPAEAQPYPGVVEGHEEPLHLIDVHDWALKKASFNIDVDK